MGSWGSKTLRLLSRRYFPGEANHQRRPDGLVRRLVQPLMHTPLRCAQMLSKLTGQAILVELGVSEVLGFEIGCLEDTGIRRGGGAAPGLNSCCSRGELVAGPRSSKTCCAS